MKKINLLLGLLISSTFLFSQSGGIRAKVLNEKGEALQFCNVSLKTDKIIDGTTTDFDGWFTFKGLNSGIYNIEISYIGYDNKTINSINVSSGKISFLNTIIMGQDIEVIGTAIVTADKIIDPENTSCVTIRGKELETMPGSKDLYSMLTAVSNDIKKSSDGNGFIVRGSRPNTSALFIDGVKTRENNPNVSGSTIKSMQVYTGGIPAAYGDITGGVIIIETKGYFDYYFDWKYKD